MDSVELLAREEQFRKLNKQLEKKSVSLLKQIETAMSKQDIFSEFSANLTLNPHRSDYEGSITITPLSSVPKTKTVQRPVERDTVIQNTLEKRPILRTETSERTNLRTETSERQNSSLGHSPQIDSPQCNCPTNNYENTSEFLYAFVSVNVQMNVMPPSFLKDKLSVESVCKFLASKVKLMQEQIYKLQGTIDKKVCQCETHLTHIAEHENERLQLLNKNNSLTAEVLDARAKLLALQNRLNEKERLYKEQRSQVDKLTSEAKRLRSNEAKIEAKCVTQEEEIDRLKNLIEALKSADKEFRASTRHLSSSHTSAIARLETKLKLLSSTIDKQRALIDNLRAQNSVLSVAQGLRKHEKDYLEFLTKD